MMPRKGYPSDKQDQYMVRLPAGMRERLKAASDLASRSLNAEIVERLEGSFTTAGLPGTLTSNDLLEVLLGIDEVRTAFNQLGADPDVAPALRKSKAYVGQARLLAVARKIKMAIWAEQFDASEDLQREFMTRDTYAAYMLHTEPADTFGAAWQTARAQEGLQHLQEAAARKES